MRRKGAAVDAALDVGDEVLLHLARKREAFVRLADAGDRPIDEHQLEVLRLLPAELVEAPENRTDALERRNLVELGVERVRAVAAVEELEALFRKRIEDVVLAGEVAVEGGRAVLDLLGDLSNGDVAIALVDEEFAGRVEDGSADGLT